MFRNFVFGNFPFLENDFDAMTDYELFCKMVAYMRKALEQIDTYNQKFVDFDARLTALENLDLQDEVDNKLDEMYENGQLQSLIEQFIELTVTFTYNTVDEMLSATNLINGTFTKTNGFYELEDGGGAYYKIRQVTSDDTIDNIHLFALVNNNLLVAELMKSDSINILQLGAYNNDSTKTNENTIIIQYAMDNYKEVIIPIGTFYCKDLNLPYETDLIGINERNSILYYDGDNNKSVITLPYVDGTHSHHNKISNFTIDGNSIAGSIGIYSNASYVKISNLYIHDCNDGIKLESCNNIEIEKCFIYSCNHSGINAQYSNHANHGQINALWIHNNNIVYNGIGIVFAGNNVIIEENTIQANLTAISVGESTWDETYNQQTNGSIIRGNYTEQTGYPDNIPSAVIKIYSGYVTGRTYNRIIRKLVITENYFVETNDDKNNTIIDVITDDTSDASSRVTSLIIKNNWSDTHYPIKTNFNDAISWQSEIINNSIYEDQKNLPYYVKKEHFNTLSPAGSHNDSYINGFYQDFGYLTPTNQITYLIYPKNPNFTSGLSQYITNIVLNAHVSGNKNYGNAGQYEYIISKNGNNVIGYDGEVKKHTTSGGAGTSPNVSPFTYISGYSELDGVTEGYQITIQANASNNSLYNIFLSSLTSQYINQFFNVKKLTVARKTNSGVPSAAGDYEGQVCFNTQDAKWYVYTNSTWRVVNTD